MYVIIVTYIRIRYYGTYNSHPHTYVYMFVVCRRARLSGDAQQRWGWKRRARVVAPGLFRGRSRFARAFQPTAPRANFARQRHAQTVRRNNPFVRYTYAKRVRRYNTAGTYRSRGNVYIDSLKSLRRAKAIPFPFTTLRGPHVRALRRYVIIMLCTFSKTDRSRPCTRASKTKRAVYNGVTHVESGGLAERREKEEGGT